MNDSADRSDLCSCIQNICEILDIEEMNIIDKVYGRNSIWCNIDKVIISELFMENLETDNMQF